MIISAKTSELGAAVDEEMMQTRYAQHLLFGLAGLTVAASGVGCSSGEVIDDTRGSFSTTQTTTQTTTGPTTSGTGSGDGDGDGETDHGDEMDTSDTAPAEATCEDGIINQGETDGDCGGPNCGPCETGQECVMDGDCATQSCVGNLCIEPSCMDGVANGGETDVDCGGPCSPCVDNLGCAEGADCVSGVCVQDVCAPPNCGDSVLNGFETDVDCGGPLCEGCLEDELCAEDSDCVSQYCLGGQCAPADCLVDADCSDFDTACTAGVCSPDKTCQASPINDGQGCDDGDLCSTGETCNNGSCGAGTPVDCSDLSGPCSVGVCNDQNGMCEAQAANENNPCNDQNACTVNEQCTGGSCVDPNDPGYVFHEDFANNSAGWSLGADWDIGPAAASNCAQECPGDDPASDHTPTGDNGVAGVLIGGCTNDVIQGPYCLTSPTINTNAIPGAAWLTFWRHLHSDYPDYMTSSVQVYNGNAWVTLWASECCECVNDNDWTEIGFDVTAYKNANFRVRFCHEIGSASVFDSGSWSIDDVTVGPAQCTP